MGRANTSVFVNPFNQGEFNPQLAIYCWLHPRMRPDLREKKLKMVPGKIYDKFGKMTMSRSCPTCHNTVVIKDLEEAKTPKAKVEGYTQNVQSGEVEVHV